MVCEYIFGGERLDDIPSDPAEFMGYWEQKINMIPEKFRDVATIELETEESWGASYIILTIMYQRPKSSCELRQERLEIANRTSAANNTRRQELRQLEYLKRKYEGQEIDS